ncbi:hypothetical protein ACWDA7_41155 [Streptomyces sp. NPDC001156]
MGLSKPWFVHFWIVKVLTTGMGETASDLVARVLGPVPVVASFRSTGLPPPRRLRYMPGHVSGPLEVRAHPQGELAGQRRAVPGGVRSQKPQPQERR